MTHLYQVGDEVHLAFGFYDQTGAGIYAVTQLLPLKINDEPQYRVRGSDDRERVISQEQIADKGGTNSSPVRQRSPHNPVTEMFNRLLKT